MDSDRRGLLKIAAGAGVLSTLPGRVLAQANWVLQQKQPPAKRA